MLLTLIIILILVGAAVVGSIYSYLMVFYSNFSESENYHKAYYASISALERGELVTKQRQPGYVGSGGFINGEGSGGFINGEGKLIYNNGGSDNKLDNFSYLGENTGYLSLFRTVNSRTNRIPSDGNGDVERLLSTGDSSNYNMMGYENAEVFLLYYDNSNGNPYSGGTILQSRPTAITGIIRLPGLLSGTFGELNENQSLVGKDGQLAKDDAIVDWQIRGKNTTNTNSFIIYPTQRLDHNNNNYYHDSMFRESDINNTLKFKFGSDKNPIENGTINHGDSVESLTVVGNDSDTISNKRFNEIFTDSNYDYVSLRFSLLNLLKANNSGNIYPFLEYYADFGTNVSDKYYTINGEGKYKDFQVNTIIRKPTVKDTVLGNFTSIF